MPEFGSLYQRYARLLAYYETAAEDVRAAIRSLARGEADRVPVRGLGVTVWEAAGRQASVREADQRADHRRAHGTSRAVIARRAQTARALAQFDRVTPRRPEECPIPVTGVGSLVRRGYLVAKAGGYIRSAKPYRVHPTARG